MEYFNSHIHQSTNTPEVLELVNQYPWEFDPNIPCYSIGIHPWFIVENRNETDLQIIENNIQNSNCRAVGECGLDKRIEISMDLQQKVFEKQLLLAQKYRKPVVIHCVAAFQELIETKKRLKISVPLLVHGFAKNAQLAKQLVDNDCYLSFGKYLLRNPELEAVFRTVPNNRFFLETDTVLESIEEVYHVAASYKKMTLEELQQQVEANFVTVFETFRR